MVNRPSVTVVTKAEIRLKLYIYLTHTMNFVFDTDANVRVSDIMLDKIIRSNDV